MRGRMGNFRFIYLKIRNIIEKEFSCKNTGAARSVCCRPAGVMAHVYRDTSGEFRKIQIVQIEKEQTWL